MCFLIRLLFLWSEYFKMHFYKPVRVLFPCGSYLAQRWTPDWGPADESPCWTVQSARQWRMRPGGPVRCTPGLLRRELQVLVHRKDGTFMLAIQPKQIPRRKKPKTNHDTSSEWLLLSSLSTASAGEVVLASHSLTVPSAEQERRRWCALLYTKPQTESVCPHNAPRSIDGSAWGGTGQQPRFNSNGHHVQTKKEDAILP